MGGHHKKNLRAEKAKVKLKGAKLPKGLNVTKTDFKVRKIEIREQLRDSSAFSTINGQRQLNLKETLSRLKHHNLKFRTDALRNVRDAVKFGQAEHLVGHLHELLQGIAAGALDIEREVRRDSFKTLDALLEALPSDAIVPFFHIIAAYLRCAMTHVQPAIQEDSLLLLDVLLHRVPSRLLAERSASAIIGHFIDMISRTRHDTQHTNRLLTVRLGQGQGQQTTIKWRTKVLLRLQQILDTLLLQQHNPKESRDHAARVVHYDVSHKQYYNVLCPFQVDNRPLHAILQERMRKPEDEQLRSYVEQLMPLLQDNWLEVRPQQQQNQTVKIQQQQLLNADAADSLHVVLNIMTQLWQLVLQFESTQQEDTHELSNWMRETYADNFVRHFLKESVFPYQQLPLLAENKKGKKGAKNKAGESSDELCRAQNLSVVLLACHFWPQPGEQQREDYGSLLQYINQCLRQVRSLTPNQQLRLVAALRALLLDNGAVLLQLLAHQMGGVMQNCIEKYVEQQFTTKEGVATRVLSLLCQIVQHPRLYEDYGAEHQFGRFLEYLPQLLLKPSVADATLLAMSTLCRQRNKVFLASLAESADKVLANIEQLQVNTGHDSSKDDNQRFEHQQRILNLFYYVRQVDDDASGAGAGKLQAILQQHASERVANYFKCILSYD